MSKSFTATKSVTINAPAAKVWDALTNPELIKQYFFGVEAESNWKEGSTIIYKGEWQGKTFEDKGIILKIEPGKMLVTNYWSGFSGLPNKPENYQKVTYELSEAAHKTTLAITQENIPTEKSRDDSEKNWDMVLDNLKQLLEK
jgi:uncharacterized protein YndB with AHSA1/START domain